MLAHMFRTKFWKEECLPAYGFCPWAMRVNIDALLPGGVKAFLWAAYASARDWT
jgi:hypothetical protein